MKRFGPQFGHRLMILNKLELELACTKNGEIVREEAKKLPRATPRTKQLVEAASYLPLI